MRTMWGAALLLAGANVLCGQAADAPVAFDVASVKMVGAGEGKGRELITPSPSGVTLRNVHLRNAIGWAYHLQAIQVIGPGWLDSDTYDIAAKAATAVPQEQLRQMMQTLLAERFKLTAHRDSKEMPAYVLSIAKGGHKLKESESAGTMELKPNGNGRASFTKVTLTQLIEMTSPILQGVVVDETGLTGSYDFTLDLTSFMGGDFHPTGIEDVVGILIRAANEQLGIKIEQKKVQAPRLVIDHIEKLAVEN